MYIYFIFELRSNTILFIISQIVSAFVARSTFHQLLCPCDIPPLLCEGICKKSFANLLTFWYYKMLQDHLVCPALLLESAISIIGEWC